MNIYEPDGSDTDRLDPAIVAALISMLDSCNPIVKKFKLAHDRLLSPAAPEVAIKLIAPTKIGENCYALPESSELAALLVGDISVEASRFDVVVQSQSGQFKYISPVHPALMALQYPILFPYGDKGFHLRLKLKETDDHPLEHARMY